MKNLAEKVEKIKSAIEHCNEICNSNTNCECKLEHRELAQWLEELLWAKYFTESGKLIKKYKFEPGDKVVVRNRSEWIGEGRLWLYREFSNMKYKKFCCTDGEEYECCLPYNDDTKKLVNTKDDSGDQEYVYDYYDLKK